MSGTESDQFTFKKWTQFHENPAVISWWHNKLQPFLAWFSADKRRAILALGAFYIAYKMLRESIEDANKSGMALSTPLEVSMLCGLLFLFFWLVLKASVKYGNLPAYIKKHPLLTFHAFYWAILLTLWNMPSDYPQLKNVLFAFALMLPYLIWRCCYMLIAGQQGRAAKFKISDHLFTVLPVYGGSETPYGKGIDFLSKFEAKDTESLAKSQLAGIKLLLLEVIWRQLLKLMHALVYGPTTALTEKLGGNSLEIPTLASLANMGGDAPLLNSWLSIYLELFAQVLHHAAYGLGVVGVLRLFGFNIFRNTYKPLLAESIVEFWNRYYYYFKELLANFFFMPTFMQLGKIMKNQPKLRLFTAVFAAAFIGNMYYHITEQGASMALGNVFETAYSLRSRFFYCFLLAMGIFISMLREQKRAGQALVNVSLMRYFKIFGVWTFFAMIYIWNVRGNISFEARTEFFLHLFGI